MKTVNFAGSNTFIRADGWKLAGVLDRSKFASDNAGNIIVKAGTVLATKENKLVPFSATSVVGDTIASLDFSGENSATITLNGESITIDTDHTGDLEALVDDLQDAVDTALGEDVIVVSENDDEDGIKLSSYKDIVIAGSDVADLGLEAGTTEAMKAIGINVVNQDITDKDGMANYLVQGMVETNKLTGYNPVVKEHLNFIMFV